jgi:FKBP-type peptidyl-prolyl cis-trans isomerase
LVLPLFKEMVLRTQYVIALAGLGALVSACGSEAALENDAEVASYAVGLDVGQSLSPAAGHLDVDAFTRGVEDALAGNDPALADSLLQGALARFSQTVQESMNEGMAVAAEENRREGEQYLTVNGANPDVTTTASGLQYEVLEEGTGPTPGPGDQVTVNYRGTLVDGTEFDASERHGGPATFQVGGVIAGFTEALQLMPVGSRYRVVIPSDLAYGPGGGGPNSIIGPDETLIFEIELLSIP